LKFNAYEHKQTKESDTFGQTIWKPAFVQLTSRHNIRKVFLFHVCMMFSVSWAWILSAIL